MKQNKNPAEPAPSAPIQLSPPFPRCSAPKHNESRTAAGQNPSPVVSVNKGYPRTEYSSANPTSRKAMPHSAPYFQMAAPCRANEPKLKTPASRKELRSTVMATKPIMAPCQNRLPKAFRGGRP